MGKFNGIFLYSDFDGTLSKDGKTVSPENLEAIRFFQREGGCFSMASGRPACFFMNGQFGFIPNAPLISLGGAQVISDTDGSMLRDRPLPEEALAFIDEAASLGTMKICRVSVGTDPLAHPWHPEEGSSPSAQFRRIPDTIYKALLVFESAEACDGARALFARRHFPSLRGERSWVTGFELLHADAGKGAALRWIRNHLPGVRLVAAAGDFENDLSLIAEADRSYAVANALPEVRDAADRVTVSCQENAIARIVEEL